MIKGFDSLQRKLSSIAELNTKEAVLEGAGQLAEIVRNNAPVNTGFLKNSITVRETDGRADMVVGAPYAFFVEYGTSKMPAQPFIRPALDDKQITAKVQSELKEELDTRKKG